MKIFVTLFVAVLALMVGCKPDYDAPCREQVVKLTHDFTLDQKAAMPYGSGDSIAFVSVSGDTLNMLTRTYQLGYTYLPTVVEGNPECQSDWDAFRMMEVNVVDTQSITGIHSFWKNENDSCWYTVADKKYGLTITQIGNPAVGPYYDSIELNQKWFYEVSTVFGIGGDSILLTKSEGVIYFVKGANSYRLESFKGM